jgi:sugar phosphate isomerase/epimerase
MKQIKGPGIFLAQFTSDEKPFNSFPEICHWAAGLGFKGIQVPSWEGRLFNLETAMKSRALPVKRG